jgi:3-oxosteroid 1-dehydrogenase
MEDSGLTPYPSAGQPNVAMYPLGAEGPYYAFIVTASAVDTNGGPVINPDGQLIRWDGTPIEGLYGAGNCIANPSVNAYWGEAPPSAPATSGATAPPCTPARPRRRRLANGDVRRES